MIFLVALRDLCSAIGACVIVGVARALHGAFGQPHFADLEDRYGWNEDEPFESLTNLGALVQKYMDADPGDLTATTEFLIAADGLSPEDCFKEASVVAPEEIHQRPAYDVMEDLARAYSKARQVPTHSLQCQLCGQIGSFSNGACHACGGAATHPSWAIWCDGRAVDYNVKRRMEKDAYLLQKEGKKITIFDSNGKQLFVAPPPMLMASGGVERIGLTNSWRDSKGRFCKSPECDTIHPMDEPYANHVAGHHGYGVMDEPYSVEVIRPEPWPTEIR